MKICSKFDDYYDTALGYGIDPHIVYNRHTEKHSTYIDSRKYTSEKSYNAELNFSEDSLVGKSVGRCSRARLGPIDLVDSHGILFCGKFIPVIVARVTVDDPYVAYEEVYCYSIEDVDKLVSKYTREKDREPYYKHYKKDKYRGYWFRPNIAFNRSELEKYFNEATADADEQLMELHFETGVPVFLFKDSSNTVYNPVLKDIQFFKAIDAYTAFQELSMFIGGVLGGQSPKMVELKNADKIHKAGFDKWSFRKHKDDPVRNVK